MSMNITGAAISFKNVTYNERLDRKALFMNFQLDADCCLCVA